MLQPRGLAADGMGGLLIADRDAQRIRRWTRDGSIRTIIGNGASATSPGIGTQALVSRTTGLSRLGRGRFAVITAYGLQINVIEVTPACIDGDPCTSDWCDTKTHTCKHSKLCP